MGVYIKKKYIDKNYPFLTKYCIDKFRLIIINQFH